MIFGLSFSFEKSPTADFTITTYNFLSYETNDTWFTQRIYEVGKKLKKKRKSINYLVRPAAEKRS